MPTFDYHYIIIILYTIRYALMIVSINLNITAAVQQK